MVSHSRRQETDNTPHADYTDDLALITNMLTWAQSLLHNLEQAVGGIDLYTNANKANFIRFKLEGAFSTLSGKPHKVS